MKYTKQPSKLQKPMNSFFHYRKAKKLEIISKFNITKSHEISRKAAELWKSESASVKEYFKEISMNEHSAFKQRHPNYDWQPWKTRLKKSRIDSYLLSPQSTSESEYVVSHFLHPTLLQSSPNFIHSGFVSQDVYDATLLDSDIKGTIIWYDQSHFNLASKPNDL